MKLSPKTIEKNVAVGHWNWQLFLSHAWPQTDQTGSIDSQMGKDGRIQILAADVRT
jgi:hypothetical protein